MMPKIVESGDVHLHPTAFARDVVTECDEPAWGGAPHCWWSGQRHNFGSCRFFANGRIWKHCRRCRAKEVETVVIGKNRQGGTVLSGVGQMVVAMVARAHLDQAVQRGDSR